MKLHLVSLVISLMLGLGCAGAKERAPLLASVQKITTKTALSALAPMRGVAIIVHGLNFNPSQMDDWVALFAEHGVHSVRLVLTGHDGERDSMALAGADLWRLELDEAIRHARTIATRHDVPLIFLGYSLGGLLGVDWLTRQEAGAKFFDKMILLAPAIATPWYSEMAVTLLKGMRGNLIIPTPNRRLFRATDGSSVNAYRALFDLKASVHERGFKNANIDTLLLVDRYDELTPYVDIRAMVARFHLSQWHLETFNNGFAKKNHGYRHLIAGIASVGPRGWREMSTRVLQFLALGVP